MNKQKLIEYCEYLKGDLNKFINGIDVNKIIKMIEQLDEPQKVTVPQFVADWYEEHKDNLEYNIWDWMKYNLEPKKRENKTFSQWLGKTVNNPVETLIKMKLYGYTVEKEKRYIVKVKNIGDGREYLKWNSVRQYWYFGNKERLDDVRLYHTLENLQKGGFGNVFVNPLFTIEEVPE
jgi:gp178|nr:MAG TPA: Protein of unknown function (DUF1642) [Caudoviricetes sp.]